MGVRVVVGLLEGLEMGCGNDSFFFFFFKCPCGLGRGWLGLCRALEKEVMGSWGD